MKIFVDFQFVEIGQVKIDLGKLSFPTAPEEPGIYKFLIRDDIYVGETDRLRRRFQHYRTPGPSQTTNIRLNKSMMNSLSEGFDIIVSTVQEAVIFVDGVESGLDLSLKSSRLLVESAVLTAARLEGQGIENI